MTESPSQQSYLSVWVLGALLTVLTFLGNLSMTLAYERMGIYQQYDIMFDTDPNRRIICYADGWNREDRGIQHLGLCSMINMPLRAFAKIGALTGLVDDELRVRRQAALVVAPAASAMTVLAAVFVARAAGVTPGFALLVGALSAVSFSLLVFGVVPDHFVLAGLGLTLCWLLAARPARAGWRGWLPWLAVGIWVTSVSLTNIVIFAIILFFSLLRDRGGRSALLAGAGSSVAVLLASVAVGWTLNLAYDYTDLAPDKTASWTERFFRPYPLSELGTFPFAVAEAIAPAQVELKANVYALHNADPYAIQFTLDGTAEVVGWRRALPWVVLIGLVAGAARGLRRDYPQRPLIVAALAVLGFNALFHALWGAEYFLYSQHWLMASLVLLFPLLRARKLPSPVVLSVFGALIVSIFASNLSLVDHMFERVQSAALMRER